MPLKNRNNDKSTVASINYKARLEKKLYLAQESPEPIFDISVCNLKVIPNNVFALCRVLRKEALYLQNNNLTNLNSGGSLADLKYLKVLNISANKFTKLPSNINELENLEVFDASKNQLVELPETIGDLAKLICLNLSYNNLKQLPLSIGNCRSMEILILTYNENLTRLPVSLAKLHSLVQLDIDPTIVYPPRDITKQGVSEILKFISRDLKEEMEAPSTSARVRKSISDFDDLQEKLELHEKLQQEKRNERLLLEKQLMEQNKKEIEIHQRHKDDKKKLLETVKDQQQFLDAELIKLQEKKNVDRAFLIKLCQDEEKKLNDVVSKILNVKKSLHMEFSKEWEKERKAEEEMLLSLSTQSKVLERRKILLSMEELMSEEILKAQRINADWRLFVVRSLASEISQQNENFEDLIKKRDENKAVLIDMLHQNEELQKSAVAFLLEKSDASSWELAQQIKIVEAQLAELTRLELAKRKLESEYYLSELSKNRIALTELLMDLLDSQNNRKKQLIETMRKMESMKESVRNSEIFWMEQYNKLLNSKTHELVKFLESVDSKLVYELYVNGVLQYLPLLKDFALLKKKIEAFNEDFLTELGIKSAEDRIKILRAVHSYLNSQDLPQTVPSAPLLVDNAPSAPLADKSDLKQSDSTSYLVPDECVICLEAKPSVIFVPCGHICCCYNCFKTVTLCPLCRQSIDAAHERKVKLK